MYPNSILARLLEIPEAAAAIKAMAEARMPVYEVLWEKAEDEEGNVRTYVYLVLDNPDRRALLDQLALAFNKGAAAIGPPDVLDEIIRRFMEDFEQAQPSNYTFIRHMERKTLEAA